MLSTCQHAFAFSKSKWYSLAFKAIAPQGKQKLLCLQQSTARQHWRTSATLTSFIKPLSNDIDSDSLSISSIPFSLVTKLQNQSSSNPNDIKEHVDFEKVVVVPPTPAVAVTTDTKKKKKRKKENTKQEVKKYQCSGLRRYDGQRCKHMVRVNSSENPKVSKHNYYCSQHNPERLEKKNSVRNTKQVNSRTWLNDVLMLAERNEGTFDTSFSNGQNGGPEKLYDCWDLWIDPKTSKVVRELLCREMKKPISSYDKDGFIYAYLSNHGPRVSQKGYTYFKVGRTTNPHRRMYQFSHYCQYEPSIIELFPSFPIRGIKTAKADITNNNLRALDQSVEQIPKCPIAHRVERLIHIELSSLFKSAAFKCQACGTTHREWIRVSRRKHPTEDRALNDREVWLTSIRPVILKWVRYGVVASAMNKATSNSIATSATLV